MIEARGEPYPTHRIIEAESQADLLRQQLPASGLRFPPDLPNSDDRMAATRKLVGHAREPVSYPYAH